jgi:periplasmic divalent cation tolerance protein
MRDADHGKAAEVFPIRKGHRMKRAPAGKRRVRVVLVLTTLPNRRAARKLAGIVLDEKAAACASLMAGLESHYVWKGKREKSQEVAVLFKTTPAAQRALFDCIRAHHPYEVPEMLSWSADRADPQYANWVTNAVRDQSPR